jgi:hypothetical protein
LYETSRRTFGSQKAGRWIIPVNVASRLRRWPKASDYSGLFLPPQSSAEIGGMAASGMLPKRIFAGRNDTRAGYARIQTAANINRIRFHCIQTDTLRAVLRRHSR